MRLVALVPLVLLVGACADDAEPATVGSSAVPSSSTTSTSATTPASTTVTSTTPTSTTPGTTTVTSTTVTSTTVTSTTGGADPAVELAERITVAERGIRDESLSDDERAAHGREQQAVYREVGSDRDVIARLPDLVDDDVRAAVAFNLAARSAVLDHATTRPPVDPPTTVPAWTIVEPRPVDELLRYYREAEAATGVEWEYLAAINLVETRMGRIVGASAAGAVGPMQFLPETWERCCTGDPTDPRDAILGAATYLAQEGAPADMQAALYAYNPNDGYVGSVTAYAANLRADERAYVGYHAWEVFVSTSEGTIRLPVGYSEPEPVDAAAWLAANPPS